MKKSDVINSSQQIETSLADLVANRYARYAKYIIQDRALPDVRDGLKPVQRRILYAMYEDNNIYSKPFKKSAKTVGNVIGNYHPHGDSSVYEAMVNMSQPWKMGLPLIEMQGNNGSIDGDSAAAMRYTESRLSLSALFLLKDIEKQTVDFKNNYSDSEQEPIVLPASFANILVNGVSGIASGYATEIPPFNFNEINNATIYRLLNSNCLPEEIYSICPGPDFPTGAIIEGRDDIINLLNTGKGRLTLKAKCQIIQQSKIQQIVCSEIPYGVKKSELVKMISDAKGDQSIDDILDIRDESDQNGLKIVIDIKKETNANNILNLLYKETDLMTYYHANMVVIHNRRPKVMGLVEMLDAFIDYRKQVVLRRSKFLYNKTASRLHILEGLMKAITYLDEVILIIRQSANKKDSKERLIARFDLSQEQAEAIVMLQLYRLSQTDMEQLKEEFALLLNDLEHYNQIINNQSILIMTIVNELKDLNNQIVTNRRCQINDDIIDLKVDKEALINVEDVYVSVSRDGYVKKISVRSFNSSDQKLTTFKQDDVLIGQKLVSTINTLIVVFESGNFVSLPVYSLLDSKWKDVGSHISAIVNNTISNDKIIAAFVSDQSDSDATCVCVSKLGKIKQVSFSLLNNKSKRLGRLMKLEAGDSLISAYTTYNQEDDVCLLTTKGYMVRYGLNSIPIQGLSASGVNGIKLQENDTCIASQLINNQQEVILITTDGCNKRLKALDITLTNRPAKGILVAKMTKSGPKVLDQLIVTSLNSILLFNDGLELNVSEIKLMNRDQGFSTSKLGVLVKGIEKVGIYKMPTPVEPNVIDQGKLDF